MPGPLHLVRVDLRLRGILSLLRRLGRLHGLVRLEFDRIGAILRFHTLGSGVVSGILVRWGRRA